MEDNKESQTVVGRVKWFDPTKGFGFVVADGGGPDILLHANVLRNFGQSSVADDASVKISIQKTERGVQALEVFSILPPKVEEVTTDGQIEPHVEVADGDLPFHPARVKWFDKAKGFGFANVFGSEEDIFVHVETLRKCGFADLQPGEAVCLKVVDGQRGRMASSVASWDIASKS